MSHQAALKKSAGGGAFAIPGRIVDTLPLMDSTYSYRRALSRGEPLTA